MTYHALHFDIIPGFSDLPDTVLDAERLALGREAAIMASNAGFGMVRMEMFQGTYANGEQVALPVSSVDGYRYSREELTYVWGITHTANRDTNWMTGPDCLWYAAWLVNQSTGLVSCVEYYRRSGSHADPATSNDGVLQVFTIAQRAKTTLSMTDVAQFKVDQLTDYGVDQAWTEQTAQDLNHRAKFAAVKSEAIYMGEFVDGDQVPAPTSPVDGYVYDYSEVSFVYSWRWTCKSSAFGQPDMALGQLGPIKADVDLTGNVSCQVTMYNNGLLPQTTFGRLSVVAITKRMTTYFRLDARTMPWSFAGGINSSFPIVDPNGLEPLVCKSVPVSAGVILSISASSSRNTNAIRRGATGQDSGPGGNTDTFPGGKTPPSTYNDPSWDLFNAPGCIIGAFTDDDGNVLMVFGLGTGTPSTITVPSGATRLNLGINDVAYANNTGYFIVQIGGMSQLDNFTEQDLSQFMPGEVMEAPAMSITNTNAIEAAHAIENFGPFIQHDGDTIALPVSFFDGYQYSRAELTYMWEWSDTTPDTGTHLRTPLFGAHVVANTGVVVVKPYRLADGGPVVAGGSGFGSIKVTVIGVRQSIIQTYSTPVDNPPGDVGSIPADLPGGVQLQVEDVDCGIQTLANFKSANGNLIITDGGDGSINFDASGGGGGGGADEAQAMGKLSVISADGASDPVSTAQIGDSCAGLGSSWTGGLGPSNSPVRNASSQRYTGSGDSYAGWYGSRNYPGAGKVDAAFCGYILRTTDIRFYAVLTDSPSSFPVNDNPAGSGVNYAGFRYSTLASDANYQCVTGDGATQQVVDTGVAADNATHTFGVQINKAQGKVLFYLDGALVGTISANLPTASTLGYSFIAAWHSGSANPMIGFEGFQAQAGAKQS